MRVLVVDDHALFADAIRAMLEAAGHEVLPIARNGSQAVEIAVADPPDVALIDVGLPDQSGLVVGQRIREVAPATRLVALTALDDPVLSTEATRIGFHGFLTKDTNAAEFLGSIEDAARGRSVVRPLPRATGRRADGVSGDAALLAEQLTPREREVLALLIEGVTGPRISERLGIAPNTVRTHVQSILSKLQVHSRLEAAAFAIRHGLVGPTGAQAHRRMSGAR